MHRTQHIDHIPYILSSHLIGSRLTVLSPGSPYPLPLHCCAVAAHTTANQPSRTKYDELRHPVPQTACRQSFCDHFSTVIFLPPVPPGPGLKVV